MIIAITIAQFFPESNTPELLYNFFVKQITLFASSNPAPM